MLMDERGFGYVEVLFAIFFVSVFLLLAFTHYEQILIIERRIQEKWDVFWLVKNEVALWKKDLPREDGNFNDYYTVHVQESWLSTNIKEGEFTVSWTEENSLKTISITAYKLVSH
ncbi:hypothetical protein [Ammoniphilus resinae]|uniref:Competence protein ComGC n=1 Tax=Ammoniphilus resinae TaxID=861532 RepID=A0ABS4GS26_9BACL|nr:hypothetical protein [Ammoniphilus resinae]MBP1932827.1 competence protein ComGC [Ammoniphilus resinae]